MTNTAFVLRLTWDAEAQHWFVLLKPTDGGQSRVFADLETALLYIARLYPDSAQPARPHLHGTP